MFLSLLPLRANTLRHYIHFSISSTFQFCRQRNRRCGRSHTAPASRLLSGRSHIK